MPSYHRDVASCLSAQDGTISRAQLVEAGCEPHDIERMLRRKELFVALPGVYVDPPPKSPMRLLGKWGRSRSWPLAWSAPVIAM